MRLDFVRSAIAGALKLCLSRQSLAAPASIGTRLSNGDVDRPTGHLGQRKEIEHRFVEPKAAALEPNAGVLPGGLHFPGPIFWSPVILYIVSAGLHEFKIFAIGDGHRVHCKCRYIDNRL